MPIAIQDMANDLHSPHRVLLIEQSATMRRMLHQLLLQNGIQVAEASTFDEGFDQLIQHSDQYFAVIIGWSPYSNSAADDLLSLLSSQTFSGRLVLVLSEEKEANTFNWVAQRKNTNHFLWQDYRKIGSSLQTYIANEKHISPSQQAYSNTRCNPLKKHNIKILFVDDCKSLRCSVYKLLSKHGYHTDIAASVDEGMAMALNNHYDLAIIDYFMPDATGDELCRQLRDHPKTSHIISSIYTGTYMDKIIKTALNAGATECMFKNESKALFLTRVNSMCRAVITKQAIEKERQYLRGILGSVGDGVYGVNNEGKISFMNASAKRILGLTDLDFVANKPHKLFHYAHADGAHNPDESCYLSKAYRSGERLINWQATFWTKDRQPLLVECNVYPLTVEGSKEGTVVAFRDISERKQMEEELRWQANHDSMTKLLNRRYFEEELSLEVKRLQRSHETSALLFIDLDQFKYINDTAGHAAGDQLLIEISQQLQSRVRDSDLLARLGGDEFAIILRNIEKKFILSVADSFRQILARYQFSYSGKNYTINASIGVSLIDNNSNSVSDVMADADLACHKAKETGRNQTHVYSPVDDDRQVMDMELGWTHRLNECLKNDTFVLCFQPIVPIQPVMNSELIEHEEALWPMLKSSLGESRIHYEVLIRMPGKDGNLILPGAFLPTAERFNLMPEIDRWVIENAIKYLSQTSVSRHNITLTINLCGQTISDPALVDYIAKQIKQHNVDPSRLVFEVTESCVISNLKVAQQLIVDLRKLGCQFALDDFGSGFCSFGHLKHLNVDLIKIDGLFTQGIANDATDREVIMAINQIAHAMGKKTVAEYVENRELLKLIHECGVDYIQGFYISKPLLDIA